jgi:hypothetical protein
MPIVTPGQAAYEAYGKQVNWLAYNGTPMPSWTDVGQGIRAAWEASAEAVLSNYRCNDCA